MKELFISLYGNDTFNALIIWTVIMVVIIGSFGHQITTLLKKFNRHYHVIGWNYFDTPDIYAYDEE
jgi:hypothetical protein